MNCSEKPPPIEPSHQPTLLVGKPTAGPPTYPHAASLLSCRSSQHTKSVLSFRSLGLSVCDRDGAFQFATRSVSPTVSDHSSEKGSLLEQCYGLEQTSQVYSEMLWVPQCPVIDAVFVFLSHISYRSVSRPV